MMEKEHQTTDSANATTASAECPKCGGKLKQLKVGSVCRKCYLYWLEPPKVPIDYAPAGSKTLAAQPNIRS
jgi:predicted Zn-ribbon and HTH transcriptional regulator